MPYLRERLSTWSHRSRGGSQVMYSIFISWASWNIRSHSWGLSLTYTPVPTIRTPLRAASAQSSRLSDAESSGPNTLSPHFPPILCPGYTSMYFTPITLVLSSASISVNLWKVYDWTASFHPAFSALVFLARDGCAHAEPKRISMVTRKILLIVFI